MSQVEEGKYEGELNENQQRHGKGTCRWPDGTEYTGEWVNDKKHGYGELRRPDGHLYKGYFENDMRHGKGEMFFPNGEVTCVTFVNDRMHGKGYYIDVTGKKTKAVWYYDLLVPFEKQNTDCYDKFPLNLFFVLAIYGFVIPALLLRNYFLFIGAGVFYLI